VDDDSYWAIAEADLEIQNPATDRKLRLLDDYCDIRDGLRILDIGCGKAWLLRQWAERFEIDAVGIESNKVFVDAAVAKRPARGKITIFHGKAEAFEPPDAEYDVVLCLGSAHALGGFVPAVDWMTAAAKPGGAVVIGDLTMKHRPVVNTHEHYPLDPIELIGVVERHGADVSAVISASDADFERYVSHHRHTTLRWARENPTHRDHDAVLDKTHDDWMYYLRTIRPMLGWTIFVGQKR
jgi:cyclopropane fatty-acyl-phospholipid synthase-like methyltransferase